MQSQKLAKLLLKLVDRKDKNRAISVADFLQVIKNNNLNYLLPSIHKFLEKIKRDETEKSTEKIISPFELNKEVEKEIKDKYSLENSKQVIDKKIIAGFKIYTRNKIVDASLGTMLKHFESADSPLGKKNN